MRFPLGPGPYRDRLLDAMASLLVDLHRAGVFWGDCSLANTLFRRDGDKIQAYLVDAETSEIHPVAVGRPARLRPRHPGRERRRSASPTSARCRAATTPSTMRSTRPRPSASRYTAVWDELHLEPELVARRPARGPRPDPAAQRPRLRGRRDLPRADLAGGEAVRLRVAVANRRFHARELQRLTGLVALEGQARLLLNDLREYQAWLELSGGSPVAPEVAAERWLRDVLQPSLRDPGPGHRPGCAIPLQAYCDVLEEKWLLSEAAGHDVGLDAAMAAYLELGAPGARGRPGADGTIALDIDWSGGFDSDRELGRPTVCGAPAATPWHHRHGCTPRERSRPSRSSASAGWSSATATRRRRRHRLRRRRAARSSACSGPNGAGKTTTVEILEGLREPGRRPGDGPRASTSPTGADALKPRIGVSLQTAALYPKLTVVELIDLFRSFYPRSAPDRRADRRARARRAAQRPDQGPVGRPAPAAGGRPRPGQRPGAHLPRRADDRPRPGRPAVAVGPRPGAQGATAGRSC